MEPSMALLTERVFVICYAALGVSLVMHPARWARMLRPGWNDPDFAMRLGAIPLVVGAVLVVLHPDWTADLGSVVTAVGWLAVFKGLACLWRPEWMEALGKAVGPSERMFRVRGVLVLVLSGLAGWHAFGGSGAGTPGQSHYQEGAPVLPSAARPGRTCNAARPRCNASETGAAAIMRLPWQGRPDAVCPPRRA